MLLFASMVTLSAPLVLAAMGGLMSERSGVMNIALEGTMLASACVIALVGARTHNPFIGLAAGMLTGMMMMALHGLLTQVFSIDQIISGMSINALAAGGTSFINKALITPDIGSKMPTLPIQLFWVLALVAVAYIWFYLTKTSGGLRLLAIGNDPDKSRQMGLEPVKMRFLALLAAGLLCGLAGALIITNSQSFTDGMSGGRGFIALAALIVGGWKPLRTLAACIGFGLIEAVQLQLQGTKLAGASVPTEFWTALPYLVTLVALAGLLGRNRPPAGLGKA